MSETFIKNIKEIGVKINIDKDIQTKLAVKDDKIDYKNVNETVKDIYEINYKGSSLMYKK